LSTSIYYVAKKVGNNFPSAVTLCDRILRSYGRVPLDAALKKNLVGENFYKAYRKIFNTTKDPDKALEEFVKDLQLKEQ